MNTLEIKGKLICDLAALKKRTSNDDCATIELAISFISSLVEQLNALRWLASKPFRAKSEKIAPGQLALDFIAHLMRSSIDSSVQPSAASADTAGAPADLLKATDKQPRNKRKSNIEAIPVRVEDKTVPESERRCLCCDKVKEQVNVLEQNRLVFEPAKLTMVKERIFEYACNCGGSEPVAAQVTPQLISNSICSSSLLSHLVTSRIVDSTPTERTGRQFARHGAHLASSTLHDWFARAGDEAQLLAPCVRKDLLLSKLISLDDTPLPTKNLEHIMGIQRGRLWLYIGDVNRVAYCEFSPDWKGCHPQKVLTGFGGRIQNDGYGGIAPLFRANSPPVRVGCNDHCRRRFVEALKQGDKRADGALRLYNCLYAVEREHASDASAEQRVALRQQRSLPLWTALGAEIDTLERAVEPKSTLGKAIQYWRNQQPYLRAFLSDGLLPISNVHVERLLRTVALYRKNSLFVGSLEAGPRFAALMTLALNCALANANPYEYFVTLFDRLAAGWPAKHVTELLPRAWVAERQAA